MFEELLQKCIDSGFDDFDQFLRSLCRALDKADIKPEQQTTEVKPDVDPRSN